MYIDNKTPHSQKLLNMSEADFDAYMCQTYSSLFRERGMSKMESCMHWGFDIGKGWYPILDQLCQKLLVLQEQSGLQLIFKQIKEKFGTGRFYFDIHHPKPNFLKRIWNHLFGTSNRNKIIDDIMSDLVHAAEDLTVHTCACCGEYHSEGKPRTGIWIHDTCNKCLLKIRPELKESFEKTQKLIDLNELFAYMTSKFLPEELAIIEKTIADAQDRIEDNSNKN